MADTFDQNFTKFDDAFMGMLQHCGKIEPFLNVVFSFLARRTDFFHLMHKRDDKLGFPPGVAEKMLIKIFEKYQEKVLRNDPIYMKWKESEKQKAGKDSSSVEDSKSKNTESLPQHEKSKENSSPQNTASVSTCTQNIATKSPSSQSNVAPTTGDSNPLNSTEVKALNSDKKDCEPNSNTTSDPGGDCFNGGITDKYSWSQTISDVDLKIPVPSSLKKAKDLSIEIHSDSINVSFKNDPPVDSGLKSKIMLAGTLKERIRADESLWSLNPGDHIAINLEKFQQKWWQALLVGEDEIDRSSIDTTQQVHDFDTQTQADIRKVMFDQQQKLMGKPTSDEMKTHELLEKAWDAEGSPFRGTPFDPSSVNIANNDGMI